MTDYSTFHRLAWAEQQEGDEYHIECTCGRSWTRERLADAAIALERHQHDPHLVRNRKAA